jgi:hypothetical protein
MKYVVVELELGKGNEKTTKRVPLIFPNDLIHADMARVLEHECIRTFGVKAKTVSAGTIDIDVESVSGESVSLGLKSRGSDKQLIDMYDYFHGMCI